MENPYQPPSVRMSNNEPLFFSTAKVFFFIVNFSCALVVVVWSATTIVRAILGRDSPAELLVSIFLIGPSCSFCLAEWVAYYRDKRSAEQKLGFLMLGLAALTLFGVVANIYEAITTEMERLHEFVACFGGIGISICLYCALCGLFRLCPRLFTSR